MSADSFVQAIWKSELETHEPSDEDESQICAMGTAFPPRFFAGSSNGNVAVCDLHQGNQGY